MPEVTKENILDTFDIKAKEFDDLVDTYFTINEPQVYALMAYTNGTWPPNKKIANRTCNFTSLKRRVRA